MPCPPAPPIFCPPMLASIQHGTHTPAKDKNTYIITIKYVLKELHKGILMYTWPHACSLHIIIAT